MSQLGLFGNIEDVPREEVIRVIPPHARRCAVCPRRRPQGGYLDEVNIHLSGNERLWICSERCRLFYTTPGANGPWRGY